MKIGILGSGAVGQALATGLTAAGHEVRIGSREAGKLAGFAKAQGIAHGTFDEVARFAEVAVICVKGDAAEPLARQLAQALAGKVVLDTTNPISGPPVNGVLPYFTGPNESLLERIQRAAPQAKVVKWMNSVGAALMARPKLAGGRPAMFICGDDAGAREVAARLSAELGWQAEDVGPAAMGHPLEALCQIWCAPGFLRNEWAHAFALLRP